MRDSSLVAVSNSRDELPKVEMRCEVVDAFLGFYPVEEFTARSELEEDEDRLWASLRRYQLDDVGMREQ